MAAAGPARARTGTTASARTGTTASARTGTTASACTGTTASARTGTTTLRVTDELDLATLPALRARVERALLDRPEHLVVDLSDCAFTGVDAVQALAVLSEQADRQGTELVLVGLRRVVHRVIDLVGLQDCLHCAPLPRQATTSPTTGTSGDDLGSGTAAGSTTTSRSALAR